MIFHSVTGGNWLYSVFCIRLLPDSSETITTLITGVGDQCDSFQHEFSDCPLDNFPETTLKPRQQSGALSLVESLIELGGSLLAPR